MDIILQIDYYRKNLSWFYQRGPIRTKRENIHHHLESHAESFCNSLLRIALEAGRVTVTDYVLNFIENILWSVASVCVHPSSLAPTNSEFRQFPGMEDV